MKDKNISFWFSISWFCNFATNLIAHCFLSIRFGSDFKKNISLFPIHTHTRFGIGQCYSNGHWMQCTQKIVIYPSLAGASERERERKSEWTRERDYNIERKVISVMHLLFFFGLSASLSVHSSDFPFNAFNCRPILRRIKSKVYLIGSFLSLFRISNRRFTQTLL